MPGVSYLNMYVSCCRRTFTFQMTGRQKYTAAMTGTIQGPIYLHLAQEWLSWCDSGLWGWLAGGGTQGSLGSLPSSTWQELAPTSTNLSERNSELLPSRYFVACHHRGKFLMLRFPSLLFTDLGRCALRLPPKADWFNETCVLILKWLPEGYEPLCHMV